MKVYCLFGLGFGEHEDAWELLGVYTNIKKARAAQRKLQGAELDDQGLGDEYFDIRMYDLF